MPSIIRLRNDETETESSPTSCLFFQMTHLYHVHRTPDFPAVSMKDDWASLLGTEVRG